MQPNKAASAGSSQGGLHRTAIVLGVVGALLAGAILVAIGLTLADLLTLPYRGGETSFAEMGLAMVYILAIPAGALLAALVWIPGIFVARKALRTGSTTSATLGLGLSVASPLLVLGAYLIGFMVLSFAR